MIDQLLRRGLLPTGRVGVLPIALLLVVTACGGAESGSSDEQRGANLPPPAAGAEPTFVKLHSDIEDPIGRGEDYSYTNADARITVEVDGGRLRIEVEGDERWRGVFQLPEGYSKLQSGSYPGLERYDPPIGGMEWTGRGRYCLTLTGWLIIDGVTYEGTTLTAIDLQFEQHCGGGAPALHGEIHWAAADATSPPGPVVPPPAGLWKPAAGTTPDTGNYVYLEIQPGDVIGGDYLYTEISAFITVSGVQGHLSVSVIGNETWTADFEVMDVISRLELGYYPDLRSTPFHNPAKGGLYWWGERRGCDSLTGWFVVDSVAYDGPFVTAIDLRFEQRCEEGAPALHGEIHWDANDSINAPGPVVPPPADLWEPEPGVTPATGNYVYLESEPGDYVAGGGNYLYTSADTVITMETRSPFGSSGWVILDVSVVGDERWRGDFQAMDFLQRLEVGYYGDLQRYPFHNPVKGGLAWYSEDRDCDTVTGWFVIDSVIYDGPALMAIDLRFAQHCEGGGPALHGEIHWDANDPTIPPGPVVPPPAGLWEPAPGITPTTGNYIYLESEPGDSVAQGETYLYTQVDSGVIVSSELAHVNVSITGDQKWIGGFQGMDFLDRIEVGYYADLGRDDRSHNPLKGGLEWRAGGGRICPELTGWFVVDSVTYEGSTLTTIDLRFEQHCEEGAPALYGEIHWDASDPTSPPGPVVPPPAGLWEPDPGVIPATGNYVYLESDAGDRIGVGTDYLYTDDSQITVGSFKALVDVLVEADESWSGLFRAMSSLSRIEPGYYGDLQLFPGNSAKGDLRWSGEGRSCETATGWFVVDSVSYVGETLTALDLRFEQHCAGNPPALHGAIHWSSPE